MFAGYCYDMKLPHKNTMLRTEGLNANGVAKVYFMLIKDANYYQRYVEFHDTDAPFKVAARKCSRFVSCSLK